jgi:hypothetical protein
MDLTGPEALYLAGRRGAERPLDLYLRLEWTNEAPGWLDSQVGVAYRRVRRTRSRHAATWYARVYAAARRLIGARSKAADDRVAASRRLDLARAALGGSP